MSGRDKTIALIGGIAVVLLLLTFIGYATLSGRSVESVLPTIIGFATPVVVTLLASAGMRVDLGRLQTKVNGNYDELAARNEELSAALAQVTQQFQADTGKMPAVTSTPTELIGRHARREGPAGD